MRHLLSFPDPLNERAARIVAAAVLALALVTLGTGFYWLLLPLAYGFIARTLAGPKLSPLAYLASRHIAPRLGPPTLVPGPPKRFAQGIGAVLSTVAATAALGTGSHALADGLLAALALAAGLESIFACCIGCRLFGLLMRAGLVPQSVCEDCADIWSRSR